MVTPTIAARSDVTDTSTSTILNRNTDGHTRDCKNSSHLELQSANQERLQTAAADPSARQVSSKNRVAAAAKFAAAARLSLVNLNHLTILVWREETPCERRFGNRGGATTASGILGHLGAKTKLCET